MNINNNYSYNSKQFRILQHNCALSTNVMHSILNAAVTTADIIFLQEPWLSADHQSTISHPAFKAIIPRPANNRRPRVITFFSTSSPSIRITERSDIINDEDCQIMDISS